MANLNTHPTGKYTALAAAITTLLLIAGGCNSANHPRTPLGEQFYDENAPRATGNIAQSQAAAGAQADGMLYDHNFHGAKLNSLGQAKLNLIVKGTPAGDPVVVYLNVPQDGLATRRPAVLAYLKEGGLKDNQIKLIDGPNVRDNTPTAKTIQGIYKAKEGSYDGEMAATDTTGGGMGAAPQGAGGGSSFGAH